MSDNEDSLTEIKRRAMDWHTVMNSGAVDEATARAFEGWLHADKAHKHAYHALEQMWRDLDYVAMEADVDVAAALKPSRSGEWRGRLAQGLRRPSFVAAGLAAAVLVTVLVLRAPFGVAPAPPDYETQVAEIREITLEDGSVVTLGARSQLETTLTDDIRQATLISGEAFFEIAKDEVRPFYVAAGDTLIRVVGTKFDVKRAAGDTHVAVLEGIVDVMKTEAAPDALAAAPSWLPDAKRLTAGQKIVASAAPTLPEVRAVERATPGAWRDGRLAYEDASLREIVEDVNRYHDRPIRLAGGEIGDLRFTLGFRTSEIDVWLELLEQTQGIDVVDRGRGEIVLRARR